MTGDVNIPRHRSDEVAETYREAFRVFCAHPLALLGPGLVFFATFSLPQAFLEGALEDVEEVTAVGVGGVALVLVISFVASYLYYGYCEEVLEQARHGPVSIRQALSATLPVLPALVVGSVLVALGVLVGLALAILPGLPQSPKGRAALRFGWCARRNRVCRGRGTAGTTGPDGSPGDDRVP